MEEKFRQYLCILLGLLLATAYLILALVRELFCAFILTIPFWVFGNLGAQLLVILVWMTLVGLGSAPAPTQLVGEFIHEDYD